MQTVSQYAISKTVFSVQLTQIGPALQESWNINY